MTGERDGDQSEGAQLADALDQLFKSGNFGQVMDSIPSQNDILAEDEALRQTLNRHIEAFCHPISADAIKRANPRSAAYQIRTLFVYWKENEIEKLKKGSASESEIRAVEDLTLKGVAEYAREQFQVAKHDAATLEPGSTEQLLARENSDRWFILEGIITPAADPD